MQIEFRLAMANDLQTVTQLVHEATTHMIQQGIEQWDDIYPAEDILQEDIEKKQLVVGRVSDRLAVIYVLNQECDEAYSKGQWQYAEKTYFVIHRLCVSPAFQHQGVASLTMKHIEAELKKKGIAAVRLDAYSKNPYALKLYENFGYVVVGDAYWRKGRFYLMEKYL